MRLERYRGTRLWGTPLSYIEVCLDYILKAAGIHMYIWWKLFMHDCVKEIRFERDKAEVVAVVVIWAKYCRVAVKQLKGRGNIRGCLGCASLLECGGKGEKGIKDDSLVEVDGRVIPGEGLPKGADIGEDMSSALNMTLSHLCVIS